MSVRETPFAVKANCELFCDAANLRISSNPIGLLKVPLDAGLERNVGGGR